LRFPWMRWSFQPHFVLVLRFFRGCSLEASGRMPSHCSPVDHGELFCYDKNEKTDHLVGSLAGFKCVRELAQARVKLRWMELSHGSAASRLEKGLSASAKDCQSSGLRISWSIYKVCCF
jgi:hypothetical protein